MICQQQTVAEAAPAMRVVPPAAGLSSFYCFAVAEAAAVDLVAVWVVTAAASSGFC